MTDTELDAALRTHARHWRNDFGAPPLAGMLEVAVTSKRSPLRWAGPLIAAVLLLAIPLITVLSLHHHARSAPAVAPVPKGTPVGTVTWKDAVLQDDGTITVLATYPGSDFCKYAINLGVVASDFSAETITITVTEYQNGPAKLSSVEMDACSPPGGSLKSSNEVETATIRLSQPLGNRSLIDAEDGTQHQVLDAKAIPKVGYVPPGYNNTSVSWDEPNAGSAVRSYSSAKADFTIVRTKYVANDDNSDWDLPAKSTGTVLGHPAKYANWGGSYVTWLDSGDVWSVTSRVYDGVVGYLSEAELFKIANSLH